MSEQLTPTPGQTVGPFYGYALPFDGGENLVDRTHPQAVRLHGVVYDGNGDPVPDSLLEIWQANAAGRYVHVRDDHPAPLDPAAAPLPAAPRGR